MMKRGIGELMDGQEGMEILIKIIYYLIMIFKIKEKDLLYEK